MVTNNYKFLAKFHSGALRITDPMRLMSFFSIITRTSIIGFVLLSTRLNLEQNTNNNSIQ